MLVKLKLVLSLWFWNLFVFWLIVIRLILLVLMVLFNNVFGILNLGSGDCSLKKCFLGGCLVVFVVMNVV